MWGAWHLQFPKYVKAVTFPLWPAKWGFRMNHGIWKVCMSPYVVVLSRRNRQIQVLGRAGKQGDRESENSSAQYSDQSFAKENRDYSLPSSVPRLPRKEVYIPFGFQHEVHWRERKIFFLVLLLSWRGCLLCGLFLLQCLCRVFVAQNCITFAVQSSP